MSVYDEVIMDRIKRPRTLLGTVTSMMFSIIIIIIFGFLKVMMFRFDSESILIDLISLER